MKTLRTLFSGGELFGVGAGHAGYRHLDGYEISPTIAAVACLNGFDVRVADVCVVEYATLPPADHLHASPSCKNASQARHPGTDAHGEKLPRETAQDLAYTDAVCRAIAAHQGETFTLENVWGYRAFESFDRIRAALSAAGFSYEYWHLNAADYGVPQTRKRLIMIARRGLCRVQRPHPTHRQGGDMFHAPWVGWYAAIEGILHTLPPTTPARWQLARMPQAIRESMLLQSTRSPNGDNLSKNTGQQWGDGTHDEEEPAFSIMTDHKPSHMPKAYIVGGGNTQLAQINSYARLDSEPMFTVSGSDGARKVAATYLLNGENAGQEWGKGYREACEPSFTISSSNNGTHRAYTAGRWVRMTVQALGRFQTVPDSYVGLTPEINGNGVPCLLARRIMESL